MLHTFVPAAFALEDDGLGCRGLLLRGGWTTRAGRARSAVRADALGRGVPQRVPAPASDVLEGAVVGLLGGAGGGGAGPVHAAEVLGEEVFAVEVVGGVFCRKWLRLGMGLRGGGWGGGRGGTRHAGADVASVDARAEVLGRDVAFPFVLGAKAGGAAIAAEGAGEGAGVRGEHVFLEGGW